MIYRWFYSGQQRSCRLSLFWTLLIVISVGLLLSKNITYPTDFQTVYKDTGFQLSAAINAEVCHAQHRLDPNMLQNMRSSEVSDNTRLFAMPAFNAMPLQQYCTQHIKDIPTTIAIVKNFDVAEALPLYWLDRAVLLIFGNITFLQMAIIFRVLQLLLIGIFTFYLLSIGVRWPSVWVITLLAGVSNFTTLIQALNIHGFVMPVSLAIVALYGIAMRFGIYRKLGWHIAWLALIAVLEFWLFYGRSSQLFGLIAINVLYILWLWQKCAHHYRAIVTMLAVKAITIGLIIYLALWELGPNGLTRDHPVIHSVILGLSLPENSLAKQQKIIWEDKVGLAIVQRFNPHIDTLYTPEYNTILKNYYLSLWQQHTHQMVSLYYMKFYDASNIIIKGFGFYLYRNYHLNLALLFYPFAWLNGYFVLGLLLLAMGFFLYDYVRKMSNGAYVMLGVLILTFLNLLENALISTYFTPRFQANFMFAFLVWVYLFYGSLIYGLMLLVKKLFNHNKLIS